MYEWTDERLEALSTPELKNLLGNAERKSAEDLAAKCKAVLEARNALKPSRLAKPRTELKEFEHAVADQIAAVGREMAAKYDLSEDTAKARSADVKGFRAHKLLDSKGSAKLGGHQRNGSVAVDRYISYRRGNDVVSLGVWLLKDSPVESHEFHVIAPSSMIEGGRTFAEVRPGFEAAELQPGRLIRAFKDLDEAAAAFDSALARITA